MYEYFKVEGAGSLEISKNASAVTGQSAGFHIGVSWTDFKFCGGVMSRAEAKKLADHIYKALEECTDTEEECVLNCFIKIKTLNP